jgi:hypothetical protein
MWIISNSSEQCQQTAPIIAVKFTAVLITPANVTLYAYLSKSLFQRLPAYNYGAKEGIAVETVATDENFQNFQLKGASPATISRQAVKVNFPLLR